MNHGRIETGGAGCPDPHPGKSQVALKYWLQRDTVFRALCRKMTLSNLTHACIQKVLPEEVQLWQRVFYEWKDDHNSTKRGSSTDERTHIVIIVQTQGSRNKFWRVLSYSKVHHDKWSFCFVSAWAALMEQDIYHWLWDKKCCNDKQCYLNMHEHCCCLNLSCKYFFIDLFHTW